MLKRLFLNFINERDGNVALITAIIALPLLLGGGVLVDYTLLTRAENALQIAADNAALASAKELTLSNATEETIEQLSESYVFANLTNQLDVSRSGNTVDVATDIDDDELGLRVNLEYNWRPFILQYIKANVLPLRVSAKAKLAAKTKICMVALDPSLNQAIHLTKHAKLEAQNCGVYSNSTGDSAIRVDNYAGMTTGITCSAGGVRGKRRASFSPDPVTDCPAINDPLASRIPPNVGPCDHKKFWVTSGNHVLNPGTYCRGLRVGGTAKVKLNPGIYVITDQRLEVTDQAVFEGENVSFYLSGNNSKLLFQKQTTINLTAPKKGQMAGLLIFEDRNASRVLSHKITSDNARMLLGTIYLPNGKLLIDSEAPVADQAAYTAIIARTVKLSEGPTLHLNSNYEASDVPLPPGLDYDRVYLSE